MKRSGRLGKALLIIGSALLALVIVAAVLLLTPVTDPDLTSHPNPAVTYQDAAARIEAVKAADSRAGLIPEGNSIALLTGAREATAVVIFHGFTSVPEQFRLIAEGYRAQGYNVWVPRLPYHGQTDRMTSDFSKLTAPDLRKFADENIDIAAGLGRKVIVIGFSGGGSLGAWSGAERPEVSKAILISPLLHPLGIAEWQGRPLVRALRLSPRDIYNWWVPAKQDRDIKGYNYPRFSLKGIAALLSLSQWVDARAADGRRSGADVLLIRNNGDQRLDSAFNERFAKRTTAPGRLTVFEIPASAQLKHNFISPEVFSESYAHITVAYRYLSEALRIPLPDPLAAR